MDYDKIIEQYKIMSAIEDLALSRQKKIDLIAAIPKAQKERWRRLLFWHNNQILDMKNRHFFMQREIDLMREQQKRLEVLKKLI